ncbi:Hsp20/alpha crystallin family protein [Natronobacterium gregoryi]|uniref:Heat shock protein Hsp20 n=2 Tax=Natronobacterium gregoryi TaxID=44930 RepID=L0AHE6_NATGS|nr:Hsp20/alpha crystallin family protein [Natronobacterium gregoryi]AFZ72864.1 molecular chaperone (small heat shock protein) [Natronobacterium gregoryi SP2]ELY69646.1 heat shock protein Hsp20 [Natronobacterium gregoryi SP2]PLK21907.1 Hsp20/alpha crystallin family protein [Natronobacterium gregoryi SP2]SFI65984.1 HSP20 family protein [Natronobacterium gregoryi]
MRRDDRDEPFDDLFREIERMMNEMMNSADTDVDFSSPGNAGNGFGTDTHVDIHDTDDEIRVIADLPGVAKDNIELECDGKSLTISASSDRRQYDERVDLPRRVNEHTASATYNNGVLEVVFESAEQSSGISLE